MAANIYIYCPSGVDGLSRCDLEEELEAFFGESAEDCGAGSGNMGFNLDYELADGEDPDAWADRPGHRAACRDLRGGKSRRRPGNLCD